MSHLPQPSSSSNPSTQHVVDDRDPSINYSSSGWVAEGKFPEYQNTTHGSRLNGASMAFEFEGTQVSVYGSVLPGPNKTLPCAIFSIGSHPPVTFTPVPSQSTIFWKIFYTSPELPKGIYLLNTTIYTDSPDCGSRNPSERLFFDFLNYTASALVTSTVRHDVASPTNGLVINSSSIPGSSTTTPFFVVPLPSASAGTSVSAKKANASPAAVSSASASATQHGPAAGVIELAVLGSVTAILVIVSAIIVIKRVILRRRTAAVMNRIQESMVDNSTCNPVRAAGRRDSVHSGTPLASTSSHIAENRPPPEPSSAGATIWDRTSSVATFHDDIPAVSADKYSKILELINSLLGRLS